MERVPFSGSIENAPPPMDLRRLKRKLRPNEDIGEDCHCSSAKRVLTEEAMATSLQELQFIASSAAAVVTTTVTLSPLDTPALCSSIAWPTQSVLTMSSCDTRIPVACGVDPAEPALYDYLHQEDVIKDTGNGTHTWQDDDMKLSEENSDDDEDDSESGKVWLAPELTKTLEFKNANGAILPSAVLSEIAHHSIREGKELEKRVPPVSREITGLELVPWVKPERVLEQSFLKSVHKKNHRSTEEVEQEREKGGIQIPQTRDAQSLDNDYDDSVEQMET